MSSTDLYKNKYLKYRNKYLNLKNQIGCGFNPSHPTEFRNHRLNENSNGSISDTYDELKDGCLICLNELNQNNLVIT